MSDKLVVCMGKGAQKDLAASLANKMNVPLVEKPGEELTLLVDSKGVSLCGFGLSYQGCFDDQMLRRVSDGRLQHEMLVRVTKTKEEHPKAIDATAGMGEDSFLLAAAGYEVTMYEQNPVIGALLKDALRRAKKHPQLKPIVERMHLIEGNSIELLANQIDKPHVIYLDPMFPQRQKTGLINKKLQLIQKLEQPCTSEQELLEVAKNLAPEKIVVKRPLKGTFLAGEEPNYSVKGKAIRYDCYVPWK